MHRCNIMLVVYALCTILMRYIDFFYTTSNGLHVHEPLYYVQTCTTDS